MVAFYPPLLESWRLVAIVVAAIALLDLALMYFLPAPAVERSVPGTLPLGQWASVKLHFRNSAWLPLRYQAFDYYPSELAMQGMPVNLRSSAGGWSEVIYRVRPSERGSFDFTGVGFRLNSVLGLWQRQRIVEKPATVHVYPDFAAVANYALMATDNRVSQLGIIKRRRRGQGSDFHQMREYRAGDSLRQIDWKITSRLRKPVSREYQDERDQEIVFLIDCGRRMRARDDALSHFDHALNALLLLSYIALKQGDAVGITTFGGRSRFLKPAKGPATLNRLLNALYDLQPTTQSPDYTDAVTQFLVRQNKRALVILVTNLRDEDNDDLIPALNILRRKHLVLLASLREKSIDDITGKPVAKFDEAIRLAAVHSYLADRQRALKNLKTMKIDCLDVTPDKLTVGLINRYLDIKAGGRL